MKRTGKVFFTAILLSVVMLFSACGKKFDAKEMVESYMELITTGKSDTYCKITGQSAEEATEEYQAITNALSEVINSVGDVSEETTQAVTDAFVKILAKAKYEVSEATEADGAYKVSLAIQPIKGVFDGYLDTVYTEVADMVIENPDISEVELYDYMFTRLAETMTGNLENVSYGDAKSIDIKIIKNGNTYQIENEEEIGELIGESLIDQSELGL